MLFVDLKDDLHDLIHLIVLEEDLYQLCLSDRLHLALIWAIKLPCVA